jgi:hypothetical protein
LVSDEPYLGNRGFALDILSSHPSVPGVFAVAGATQQLALGGGCTLYVAGPLALFPTLTDLQGFATLRARVPRDPALLGGAVYGQAVVADPRSPAWGLAFTAARRLVIGH